ncbi:MAG: VWA domain-containing protein [Kangiellaceae bacterium]|nr:VWA domain-containing protein [Kangiellaceae bacterium]
MKKVSEYQKVKKGLIVVAVSLAIVSCQNADTNKSQRNKSVNSQQEVKQQQAEVLTALKQEQKRVANDTKLQVEQEQIVVTGSRVHATSYEADALSIQYAPPASPYPVIDQVNRENYKHFEDSGIFVTRENPVSTFSIDVDTGSYSNVRRMLNDGYLPPQDAVRLEEFINYFDYDFTTPSSTDMPFAVSTETMVAPWNKDAHIVQIGIKGFEPEQQQLPPSNLVFLVDVSGSMQSPDKLGLVKKALKLLVRESKTQDKISLVVYAGASGVVLEPTGGDQKIKIEQAIDNLTTGGSTNGGAGIELAYKMAQQGFIKDGINRVILATDGDFNVGTTNHEQLIDLIERKRQSGVFFSGLGFGTGNYNEHLMEELTNKGNGNYGYIDSLQEAKKLLVDQRAGTLMTIAKDVKIQVEFNPNVVSEYRLLGYENRALNREDFNNDKVDAGEIGAGHSITALYEVVLTDSSNKRIDDLRYSSAYQQQSQTHDQSLANEAAMVKLRYKLPDQETSRLTQQVINKADFFQRKANSENIQFATSAASFAQLLRGGRYLEGWSWQDAIDYANQAKGRDNNGYRAEMVQLMKMAQLLEKPEHSQVGMIEER